MTTIPLEPIDSVAVTTLVDNVTDALLQDQGPAKRLGVAGREAPREALRVPAAFLEGGQTFDAPRAEHGFSLLIAVTRSGTPP